MPEWTAAGALYFVYLLAAAALVPKLPSRRRAVAAAGCACGLLLCLAAERLRSGPLLQTWVLPPVVLLAAYWTSGLLFVAPMAAAERALHAVDRLMRIDALAARTPAWLVEVLELAYVAVYPLVPAALLIHVMTAAEPDPGRFWTVILVTDFICFGVLPWVQTRPPRAFTPRPPWASRFRGLNVALLGRTSIQVNTFPSGHAAEALAVVLLLGGSGWPIVAGVTVAAVLISAGAVLGRYHYAADALAGWAVASLVWMFFR